MHYVNTAACVHKNVYSSCPHEHTLPCAQKLFHLYSGSGSLGGHGRIPQASIQVHSISGLLLLQDGYRMETAATHKIHHSSLCPQSPQADKGQVRGEQRVWPRWTGWTEVLEVGAGWMSQWMWSTVSHFSARHWLGGEGSSLRGELWIHTYPGVLLLCPPTLHSPATGPVKPAALDLGGYAGFLELSMVN